MGAEQIAVIGGEQHDGVLEEAQGLEAIVYPSQLFIHVLVQLILPRQLKRDS
jgi:hypothetical protein